MSIDAEISRLALSCTLLGYLGPTPPLWLLGALEAGLGGVVLFGSNLGDGTGVAELTDRLRAAAGREIVIALDEEGGDVTRLDTVRGSSSPGAAALGRLGNLAVTEEVHAAIGVRLARAGVTLDLAPVADVNLDPLNPVIGLRSFGDDAGAVAEQVAAAVRGVQRAGIAACLKHFPGHGATRADSHTEPAVLERSRAELAAGELLPFRAGIAAGARSVMIGHLLVPALDPDRIATVSPAIVTGLLRGELGFDGVVVSDALEMAALAGTLGMTEGFVQALVAGVDTLETGAQDYPQLVQAIPSAVQDALRTGRLTEDRLVEAAERTARLAGAGNAGSPVGSAVPDGIESGCLEVLGTLPALHRPLVVECRTRPGVASGELPWSLIDELAGLLDGVDGLRVDRPVDGGELLRLAEGRSLVLLVRDPDREPWQRQLLEVAARHPDAVLVDAGWPTPAPPGLPVLRTRGIAPGLLRAAAAALAGRAAPRRREVDPV
ncbi:glycoside hydrolase family 3 N-terminal domain-containing protein [Jatrophihabitans sp.]|uniref:glycoside hydrolase family 3 N-terminal domain-containing protein n=1 Tax=Jatrophihabitans sp. TaxID=1932789 RepID=UPI002BD560C2|nr:glycoside hydrolase family 3 N-terminal domain-containing protein [Jatrophihabitans sp.]